MLKVENLRFGYVPTVDIFRNVNFTIREGEFIAVGGKNGCGKTTITRLLVGLEKAAEGHIRYNGKLCHHLNAANLLGMYSNNQIAKCLDLLWLQRWRLVLNP